MSSTNMDAAISTIVRTARSCNGRCVINASEVHTSDYCVKVVAGARAVRGYAFSDEAAASKFSSDVALHSKESCPNVAISIYKPGEQFIF